MVDENEVKALADRLYDAAVSNAGSPSISVWETAQHAAREALRWRDETRPQQPAAAVPEGYDALRQFAGWAIDEAWQGRDIDGGSVQDKARDLGLIDEVTVAEPCSDMCNCGDGGFPTTCYRLGPVLAAERKGAGNE